MNLERKRKLFRVKMKTYNAFYPNDLKNKILRMKHFPF